MTLDFGARHIALWLAGLYVLAHFLSSGFVGLLVQQLTLTICRRYLKSQEIGLGMWNMLFLLALSSAALWHVFEDYFVRLF